jgi:hypothetical protein
MPRATPPGHSRSRRGAARWHHAAARFGSQDDWNMTTLSERSFHLLMGTLVLASTFVDPALRAALPAWRPPEVGLLTLVLGLIWVGMFAGYRGKNLEDRMRVLEDRLERLQRKLEALDAELTERRRPLL